MKFCPNDGALTQEATDDGPAPDPLIGQVVDGRYRIEKQIGEGGMGVVYLAAHTVLSRKLALKVLRGDMAKDQDVVQRFIQEGQAATSIGHQNIIDINDFGTLPDGSAYFVMEYLDGQPLTDMIKQGGSIPMNDAIGIIRQIASALGAAHQVGIVHRDLKPDNVHLIKRGGTNLFVKVLDFGIAKVGGASSKLTKTGMVFGTPHYMAPEQAAGQAVDHRTDIYALGVIMYEMFTGKVPFDADTFMGILSKHMFEPPVPPSQQATTVKLGAIEDVIMKALAKKPEERYQTMDEVLRDLEAISQGGVVQIGRAPGITPPSNLADALEPPSRTEMRISVGGTQKSKLPIVVVVALGALVVVGGGIAGAVYAFGSDAQAGTDPPGLVNVPPPPSVPDAQVVPPPPDETTGEAPRRVEIRSDPPGAQVLLAGAIIGNAPVQIPVPGAGETRELEVRMRGRITASVRVTEGSGDVIDVTLEEDPEDAREHSGRRHGDDHPSMMTSAMTTTEPAMTTTEPAMDPVMDSTMLTNDLADPWASP
jgi:serine/threonine-protein kinase